MSEHQPEEPPKLSVLFETQRGPELHTLTPADTLVRTFDEPWAYMGYVFQQTEDVTRPRFFFDYLGLSAHLIELGFKHMHATEPTKAEQELYVTYQMQRVTKELGGE